MARRVSMAAVAVLLAAVAVAPVRPLGARADIVSYQGSTSNSGWNANQADLLPTEVTDPAFGLRYDRQVSGQVFAQPVIADDGSGRRVLVTATENNEVYGVSPDSASTAAYWHVTVGAPWVIANNSATVNCTDITPNIGITSTPVIDQATHTIYLTAKTPDPADTSGATAMYKLHALSMVDGSERTGFPVTITGTADNDAGAHFDPTKELQRPGLLLMNGVVYMGFGGHCDTPTYYGWVIGVGAFAAASNANVITALWSDQKASDGFGAGIWMAGSTLASDGSGQILLASGNGTVPQANPVATVIAGSTPPKNLGESAIRLTVQSDGTLAATDFFSPMDNRSLNRSDLDLGSSGIAVLPDSFGTSQHPHVAVLGGKWPIMRSLDLANFGGFDANANHVMGEVNYGVNGGTSGTWGRPAAWPGDGGWVYVVDMSDPPSSGPRTSGLVALQRTVDGSGNVKFVVQGTDPVADADWIQTSGSPTVTSNGTSPLTAVVWAVQAFGHSISQARLMAFGPLPDSTGHLPLLFTGPLIKRGAKFTSIAVDGNHLYIGTRDDAINTAGTSHVYSFWLSQVPDVQETPYWFGKQTIGQAATMTQTLTVRAANAVSVTGVASNDAHFTVGTLTPAGGTSMQPSSTVQLPVTFTPTATGDVRSTIQLTMSDSTTVSIGVGGTGVPAAGELAATPASIAFDHHATGTTTPSSFQLSNTGGSPLTIGTSSKTGNGAFTVSGIPANGTTMPPGAALDVQVTYAPSTVTPAGSTDTGAITINSSVNSAVVNLTGTATPPGVLSVTPQHLDAGSVQVGSSSALMHFTVSNTGGTAISLPRSKPPGGDFHPLTDLPEATTLQPGESEGVDVQFSPTVSGTQTATWSLNSDGQGGPITVTFTGTGVLPPAGYWLVAADGGIFPFGNAAQGLGSTGNVHLNQPIVGMAGTPDRGGYWLVAADGGVFPFGDAAEGLGSTGNVHLNKPIVGMASTPDGGGYWLVAADGGVFPFGDAAQGLGSTGNVHLNQPIVGMAPTRDGRGYWLVAADGGIFPFGDATQGLGSTGNVHLNKPIVGMAATADDGGYWLVAADGGIFPFGDAAQGLGSTGNVHLNAPMVGMAATSDGGGYWLVAADGGIFPFGDATQGLGSMGGHHLNQPIVGMAATR